MLIITFFAFLSGIITILSPCILPVLPIVLSGSIGGKSKPLGVITGFIGSFSLFTLVLSTIVQLFKIDSQILRIFALVVIIAFGLTLIIPVLKHYFEIGISKLVKTNGKKQKKGFAGGIMLGASLGLIWTPCVGPIMASVISLAVSQQVDGGSVIIVLAYSIGTSIPLFGIMLGGQKMLTSLPWLKNNSEKVQRFFGVVMILVGISIGLGLDRQFQSSILNAFPNYGETITAIENNEIISEALNIRGKEKSNDKSLNWDNPPKNARLGNWGEAPEIVTKGEWINTLAPLTMNDLKGKVVLLDFWTYSCVNCVRTIPYLSNLYSKYKDDGFTIIGVHSPEFTFERDLGNVKKAVEDLGIDWPVVLDNNFQQWRAYNNSYWPAHFFIDANGQIRYFHFGEGSYKESEEVVQKLLKEAGQKIKVHSEIDKVTWTKNITPETYLGYGRLDNFASINEIKKE
ncbi:MAG: redoxin domain-containing protein, partial [Spirochaetales bacterium]|nr:redoxin domain-containing protein [Spirochaetales bacterium]